MPTAGGLRRQVFIIQCLYLNNIDNNNNIIMLILYHHNADTNDSDNRPNLMTVYNGGIMVSK